VVKIKEKNNNFSFLTNSLSYEEVGTKSGKDYYVKGYISTDEVDRSNEVVTREAMNSMVEQIKSGSVKLDVEHSTFTGENDIPVGKIVDAGIDEKGLWVKCTLNKSHSKFQEVWNSIKGGFLDAFSIAYKTTEFTKDIINGVTVTLLKGLELLNVAITGNPVCRGAKMTESFYKSLKYMEENKMSEETKEPVAEETKVEEPVAEVKEEPTPEAEVKEEVVEEPKAEEPVKEEKTEEPVVEEVAKPLDEVKSLKEENVALKASLKSLEKQFNDFKKEIAKPVMKGVAQTDIAEVKETEVKLKSPLQSII